MRILKVIHGYPPRYNAGSEVYSQTLCHGLVARGHDVAVFTREEDSFAPDFTTREEADPLDPRVRLHLVNVARSVSRYRHDAVDAAFSALLDDWRPDVVHIGHLNHLSTSLVREAARRELPIVFTLHDYWLMCPRGQFMQYAPPDTTKLWPRCDGQDDMKCSVHCFAGRYGSGDPADEAQEQAYWADWVHRRMAHVREMAELVDVFVAPARYLLRRFRDDFHLPANKLVYIDYGFDTSRMNGRARVPGEPFTFGYIGTHIPAKGIHHLIDAFGRLRGDARLRIWGRPRGQDTAALEQLARNLPGGAASRVEWRPEYRNQDIVSDVFNHVDAIVVPSIWAENSPLVIHEANQARVPVVTADYGGMGEYVQHEVNGLTFEHRDPADLARQMQRLLDEPGLAGRLGDRGYAGSEDGEIPSVEAHTEAIEALYARTLRRRDATRITPRPGPWRITFDTNPDTCNLRCVMCEEHSKHSPKQVERRRSGRPKRLMPLEVLERVLAEAANNGLREVIPSTMGEPLMYEHFDRIVELCVQHGVKLNLTTNGTFPGRGATGWAERIVPVGSDVKISWNGATAETQEAIMVGSRWERMLQNLRDFLAVRDAHAVRGGNRCRVTLQLTFLESNVHELADVVKLAALLGVDRVKGHHLWAHFDAIEGLSMRRNADAIARWNAAVVSAREVVDRHPLPNGERVLLDNIFELDPTATEDLAPEGKCPFLGEEAWISAEGRFDPCCAPDDQRRGLGEFGDLRKQGLMEIWNGTAYRDLVRTYRNRPLCLGCNMRRPPEAP